MRRPAFTRTPLAKTIFIWKSRKMEWISSTKSMRASWISVNACPYQLLRPMTATISPRVTIQLMKSFCAFKPETLLPTRTDLNLIQTSCISNLQKRWSRRLENIPVLLKIPGILYPGAMSNLMTRVIIFRGMPSLKKNQKMKYLNKKPWRVLKKNLPLSRLQIPILMKSCTGTELITKSALSLAWDFPVIF